MKIFATAMLLTSTVMCAILPDQWEEAAKIAKAKNGTVVDSPIGPIVQLHPAAPANQPRDPVRLEKRRRTRCSKGDIFAALEECAVRDRLGSPPDLEHCLEADCTTPVLKDEYKPEDEQETKHDEYD